MTLDGLGTSKASQSAYIKPYTEEMGLETYESKYYISLVNIHGQWSGRILPKATDVESEQAFKGTRVGG